MKLFVSRALPAFPLEALKKVYEQVIVSEETRVLSSSEFAALAKDADAVICQLTDEISAETLGPHTKFVSTYSVGVNHVDLDYLKAQGIRLSYTPDVLTEATADLAWALMLSAGRRVVEASHYLKDGLFDGYAPALLLGRGFSGKTLGIVGLGRIGKAVARRASGFGMKVLYYSRTAISAEESSRLGVERVSLEQLLAESHFVSLHCPLTSETRHLLDAAALAGMREDAVLVNTARGPVIDETALVEHLRTHPEFRVGLDVFEREPQLAKGLLDCDNAVLLPHIGSADRETRERMTEICVSEAVAFARGEKLQFEYPL